jgi:hypothetical protein
VEVGLLAAGVLADHVQRHFGLVEEGRHHLVDQFVHLLEAFLGAGERFLLMLRITPAAFTGLSPLR